MDSSTWNRDRLLTGEAIEFEHGVCFTDTASGDLDVLQLAGVAVGAVFGGDYRVAGDGELVAMEVPSGSGQASLGGVFDRATGAAYGWDGSLLRLHLLDWRMFVFGGLAGDPTYGAGAYPGGNRYTSGQFFLADRDMREVGRFTLGPDISDARYQSALSDDGSRLIMAAPSRVLPSIVDTDTAEVFDVELPDIARFDFIESVGPGERSDTVSAVYRSDDGTATTVTWGPDGSVLSSEETPTRGPRGLALASPDGRFRVAPGTLRDRAWSLGDQEDWVYSDLVDASSEETRFRVLSGWTRYGLGTLRRWLADSSAFLVEAGDPDAPLDDYRSWRTNRAHYLVTPDGDIERLPPIPEALKGTRDDPRSNWGYFAYFGGPEPSPDDADLMVFGRMAVHRRATGDWFGPGASPQPHEGDDPWAYGSGEAFFSFPNLGKDYASPGTILPPVVERRPFREQVTLRVARTGDCLNLRAEPASQAEILDCMVDGTSLVVGDPRYLLNRGWQFDKGPPAFWSDDVSEPYQMYVFVEQADGEEGWAAIQYLDWAAPGSER